MNGKEVNRKVKKTRRFNCLFQAEGECYKLFIHDAIRGGKDWMTGERSETSATYVAEKLAEIPEGATLEVHINSDGGDAFEGTAIYNLLKNAPIKTIGIVDGHAFSAATFILAACDKRIMQTGTVMLVHNAWTIAMGNADELRAVADDLDKLMESNRKLLLERCKMTEDELIALMAEDRMITPEEALEFGFIDQIGMEEPTDDDKNDPDEPDDKNDATDDNVPDEPTDDEDDQTDPDDQTGDPDDEDDTQALRADRMVAARFFKQYF